MRPLAFMVKAVVPELVKFALNREFDLKGTLQNIGIAMLAQGMQPWVEGLDLSGFSDTPILGMGDKLSLSNIVRSGVGNVISSGASSLVYGTDFTDSFKAAMTASIVGMGMADLQTGIGGKFTDIGNNPINGGEGSIGQEFPRAASVRISLSSVRSDTALRNRSFSSADASVPSSDQ